jgi:hypothetical protein
LASAMSLRWWLVRSNHWAVNGSPGVDNQGFFGFGGHR